MAGACTLFFSLRRRRDPRARASATARAATSSKSRAFPRGDAFRLRASRPSRAPVT